MVIIEQRFEPFYIISVYSPFSNRVGLPLHNTPFPGVLMKSIGYIFGIKICSYFSMIETFYKMIKNNEFLLVYILTIIFIFAILTF